MAKPYDPQDRFYKKAKAEGLRARSAFEARLDGLVSSFLGTTARNIGALFEFAERYRCILFLDEFDAIAKARDDAQEVGENQHQNALHWT